MLNDVREPPMEPEFSQRQKANAAHAGHGPRGEHPVLGPAGKAPADTELFHKPVPDHALTGSVALAAGALVIAGIGAVLIWLLAR